MSETDISRLQDRVSDLEDRVDRMAAELDETGEKATSPQEPGLDHYDEAALERLPRGQQFGFANVKTAYMNAGIRDDKKIKQRLEFLTDLGKIEQTGRFNWRVLEDE